MSKGTRRGRGSSEERDKRRNNQHAAAPSYQELLDYYKPKILLGLTVTPERADGRSIYAYFEGRIAAEIRLWEAIERKLLSPSHYFGVTDNVDLSKVYWVAGKYDERQVENLLDQILVALGKHTGNKKSSFREGVLYLSEKKLDVFFVTLNKSKRIIRLRRCIRIIRLMKSYFTGSPRVELSSSQVFSAFFSHCRWRSRPPICFVGLGKKKRTG